jgi:hypothetical protein
MRRIALGLALLAAGCSKPLEYAEYKDPAGGFAASMHKEWIANAKSPFPEWPARKTEWIGEVADQHEGVAIGSIYTVWKMSRKPTAKQKKYDETMLAATDALFADEAPQDVMVAPGEFQGHPAVAFQRELTENLGPEGKLRSHPSRISGIAIQTPDHYYVLEYRATLPLFEKNLPVFQKLRESFKPL